MRWTTVVPSSTNDMSVLTVSIESLKIFSTLATLRHSYAKYSGSSLLLNWLARPSSSKSLKLDMYEFVLEFAVTILVYVRPVVVLVATAIILITFILIPTIIRQGGRALAWVIVIIININGTAKDQNMESWAWCFIFNRQSAPASLILKLWTASSWRLIDTLQKKAHSHHKRSIKKPFFTKLNMFFNSLFHVLYSKISAVLLGFKI